jgi:hypothetical protein
MSSATFTPSLSGPLATVKFWLNMQGETGYVLITLLLLALIVMAVFIWAAFVRDPSRRRHHHHRHHSTTWEQPANDGKHGHHRHRRKRPRDMPRNPTLAETRGLPPVRPEPQEPPVPPA